MRITSNGPATIPTEAREQAGLTPDAGVEFKFNSEAGRIVPAVALPDGNRGARLVAHLQ
jgi:hypothetical protein